MPCFESVGDDLAGDRDEVGPLRLRQRRRVSGGSPASSSRLGCPERSPQPVSSVAASWTARTCLHGPRSPRWRPYHGHVQVQPSTVDRTRYSMPPAAGDPAADAVRVGGLEAHARCLDEPPRLAESWLEPLAVRRGRTAAPAGSSRRRRGRSRRCPIARATPAHANGACRPAGRRGEAPRRSAAAPSRAHRGPRRRSPARRRRRVDGAPRPSPENPRQTSGLRTIVSRAPGTSSCQPVLPSPPIA